MENSAYVVHARMRISKKVPRASILKEIIMNLKDVLGDYFNIRKLQRSKRIWFEVKTNSGGEGSNGKIKMFSRLNDVETAIFAAALESVDRVGSHEVKVAIERIEDLSALKRKEIVERAEEILTSEIMCSTPTHSILKEEVMRSIKSDNKKVGGKKH